MHLPTIHFPKATSINIPMEKSIQNKLFMRKTSDIFVFFLSVRNSLIRLPLSVPRSTIKERPRLAQEQCCLLRAWNRQSTKCHRNNNPKVCSQTQDEPSLSNDRCTPNHPELPNSNKKRTLKPIISYNCVGLTILSTGRLMTPAFCSKEQ